MKITVTQEHIDDGIHSSPNTCPVALGAKDAGLVHPWVCMDYISFYVGGIEYRVETPDEVELFASAYDDYQDVQPIEFEIDIEAAEVVSR